MTPTTATDSRIALSLFLLRVNVFIVILMWTLDKFVNPAHAARVYEKFYFITGLQQEIFYAIGALQLAIAIAFVAGFQKRWTYGLILFMHAISTFSTFREYLNPFEDRNLLFFAAWPMLAACFALYLLRDLDTLFALDRK